MINDRHGHTMTHEDPAHGVRGAQYGEISAGEQTDPYLSIYQQDLLLRFHNGIQEVKKKSIKFSGQILC